MSEKTPYNYCVEDKKKSEVTPLLDRYNEICMKWIDPKMEASKIAITYRQGEISGELIYN